LPSLGTRLSVRVAVRRAAGGALRDSLRRSGEMACNTVYSSHEAALGRCVSCLWLWFHTRQTSRTRRGQHPDDKRDVLGGRGEDHERVEDLMKAKPSGPRIWPLTRVDDCARGVEQAGTGEQGQRLRTEPVEQFGQRENGHPPEREVAARDHSTRGVDPTKRERDASRRPRPRYPENHTSERPVEHEQRDRRVTRGDEDEDRAVVKPLKRGLDASPARPSVVQRAATEECD